ncbi:MAG: metallophosphoesterase [Synechococcaceae bacterium WB9_2_170]|nr:metallophosphoesterase [Synechococcaceae bacterium WB9_2_170]
MPSRRQVLRALPISVAAALICASANANTTSATGTAPGTAHVLVTADTGSGNSEQLANGAQMAAIHGQRPTKPYRGLLQAGVPFHAVLGNHDIRTGNGDPQVAYKPFGMKGRWYTVRQGPVEFFMLDTNMNAPWNSQLPWLKSALAASTAPWKVVVGHHPIYSSGLYGDDPNAIARLTPIFAKYGVQLYINGHEHDYERTKSINGTTYLITGGGGASIRPILPNERSIKVASTYSFVELTATATRLRIDAWTNTGKQLDQAVLTR